MLDVGLEETSLHAKRRDLLAKVAEARSVILALRDRQNQIAVKLDQATSGLKVLEQQLDAVNTVVDVFQAEGLILAPQPAAVAMAAEAFRPIAMAATPSAPSLVSGKSSRHVEPFRPVAFLKCTSTGHQWFASHSRPGYRTCTHCRVRWKM